MRYISARVIPFLVVLPVLIIGFNNCAQPTGVDASSSSVAPPLAGVETLKSVSNFSTESEMWVKGRLLVQPRAGSTDQDIEGALKAHGGKIERTIPGIGVHVVQLPEQANEKAIAALLAHNPHVKFAEVDTIVPPNETATDTYFASAWHLPIINAPQAWDLSHADNITIAILDTGVNVAHPDLAAKMVKGFNFYANTSDITDVYGHGTKVAGSAAAITNNAMGIAGVAPNALIMPLKISADDGYGMYSAMASALTYAADNGARVANLSFAVVNSSTVISAAQYFKSKGGVVVNSGGNSGVLSADPNTDALLTVASTNSIDQRSGFSTYGSSIDVAAPGEGIWVTTNTGGYGTASGTSFSSPITAGVIALMMSANPKLSPTQLVNILTSTAKDLGDPGYDQYYGYGRIDAAAAVAAAKNTVSLDTQAPSVSISSLPTSISGTATISVAASDNTGIAKVELYAGGTLVGTDTASPYQFVLNTTLYADGGLTLTAKAYDAAGNVASSSVATSVRNTVDSVAPVVSVVSPASLSATRGGNVALNASATDNIGVVKMILYVDGVQSATSSSGSISYSWNTKKVSAGAHTVRVDAQDASGNTGTASIQVSK